MIGFYNYTVILTYIGVISAFVGMTNAFHGDYMIAIFCLIISGLCDMFDGVVARSCHTRSDLAKKFGVQIDSLCDVICFGVFPAVFNYAYTVDMNPKLSIVATIVSAFVMLAAIIRLAYFNVTEEERQKSTNEKRTMYQGLPVTTIAIFVPLLYVFRNRLEAFSIDFYIPLNVLIAIIGFLYILNFPVPKTRVRGMIGLCLLAVATITVLILQYFCVISF